MAILLGKRWNKRVVILFLLVLTLISSCGPEFAPEENPIVSSFNFFNLI
jgi:cyanate permease